jgi:hypothetical protein
MRWGERGPWKGEDGEAISWRTRVIYEPGTTEKYLSRFYFPRMFGFRPMLHLFHKADDDRHLHSHPWHWALSVLLCGSYDEERLESDATEFRRALKTLTAGARGAGKTFMRAQALIEMAQYGLPVGIYTERTKRRVRLWNRLTKDTYHRITRLHGPVFSLFIAGPRTPDDKWGFLTEDGYVESEEYFARRRRAA